MKRRAPQAFAILVTFVLAACSPPGPQPRIAAKVNGKEITVQRFQELLARAETQTHKPDPARFMESLIDRELIAQKAAELKLDRRNGVALALDEARAGVLVQAYVESVLKSQGDDPGEIEAFYGGHPQLFTQRRIYRVFELAVIAPPERMAELNKRAARARDLLQIAAWLKSQRLRFNVGGVTKASEQLSPQLLSRLASMKEGRIALIEVPGGASVVQLVQSEAAPLSLKAAAPMIKELLRARRRAEIAAGEVKRLRSTASIDYVVDLRQAAPLPEH